MTPTDLLHLVATIRHRRTELDSVEVKAAHGGTPRRLFEVLSAFANRTGGGVILCGLDERTDFSLVGVGNAHRLQEEITHTAASEMDPPVRPHFTVEEIDGFTVVAVEIDEVPAAQKPCYYKSGGLPGGAYIRVGNTNRQMTEYEVFGYLSSRGQPQADEDIVPGATMADLDPDRLTAYVDSLRRARPGASFVDGDSADVLARLRVVGRDGDVLRPTLAGLLVFGTYPQSHFPQLMITFVHYYGTSDDERTPKGERFLDNRRFEGSVPEMIEHATNYTLAALRKATLIEGLLRRDIPEYPVEALREAIANAVAHRDYSPQVRGSHIQIRLYADRIEIVSPGGLFGPVTEENLDEEHSTRNARLMRFMEDIHVAENRGSGIRAMLQAMRSANLEPPRFNDRRVSFQVTFRNHTLLSPPAIAWLNRFRTFPLTDRQRLALVYLRHETHITNADYRRLNHVDAPTAGNELRGLVQLGLIEQEGVSRWTKYTLSPAVAAADAWFGGNDPDDPGAPGMPSPASDDPSEFGRIVAFVQVNGSIGNAQCRALLGVDLHRANHLLSRLVATGRLTAIGNGRWRRYVADVS